MATFAQHFNLGKTQAELDFVDIPLTRDIPLFIDPFAISQRPDRWAQDAHAHLKAFFQQVIDGIRDDRDQEARVLLNHLREPNETHLGLSHGRPQGAGIGQQQADEIFEALRISQSVQTGFLTSLEECELMIEGIGRDKISDLTTNILRGKLAQYTLEQCALHGIFTQQVAVGPQFRLDMHDWSNDYCQLPVANGRPILLVPKAIARADCAYDHRDYYRFFALEYLQAEHLNAGTALVHALKNGRRVVYKKDLEPHYPCTKEYLFQFSRDHPEVLADYREFLSGLEMNGLQGIVDADDESAIAGALRTALAEIPPGNDAASEYHKLLIGVLEFVFFPTLVCPRKEHEIHQGRKRIDIVMENAARSGVFHQLHDVRHLPSAYVAFECKNYSREIANPELDQIGGRFSTNRGKVGFICCRNFENRAWFVERCRDTLRDDRGLIIAVDDEIISSWLQLIEDGRRQDIDTKVGNLVTEVWLA